MPNRSIKSLLALVLGAIALPSFAAVNILACEPEWGALALALGGDKVNIYNATNAFQDPHHVQAKPSLLARARKNSRGGAAIHRRRLGEGEGPVRSVRRHGAAAFGGAQIAARETRKSLDELLRLGVQCSLSWRKRQCNNALPWRSRSVRCQRLPRLSMTRKPKSS